MPAKIEKNDIEQGLVRKQLEFNAKQNQVLREAAQALVPGLARTTPVSDRKKHAKSHVTISNVRTDKNSYEKYDVYHVKKKKVLSIFLKIVIVKMGIKIIAKNVLLNITKGIEKNIKKK